MAHALSSPTVTTADDLTDGGHGVDPARQPVITIRAAEYADVPSMAAIRAREWETEAYWTERIRSYLGREASPRMSLEARAVFVALDGTAIAGFVAGHQTRRFGCDGELQWINVVPEHRGAGIAGSLMVRMGEWFVARDLARVCVNVEPDNAIARNLYQRFGAVSLNKYWMVWDDARRMCISSARA